MTDTTTEYQSLRQKQKQETQELVYRKAREQFMIHGYEGVGIREIAKACGMSTGAVNGNCAGKADLYQKVMGHRPVQDPTGAYAAAVLAAFAYKHREGPGITDQDLVDLAKIGTALAGMVEFNTGSLDPSMTLEQMQKALTPVV